MAFIEVGNLKFKYNEEDPFVIDGVNMQIQKGEFVAILGHNGSGKSTLAKHFNAVLTPTEGKVFVNGMDTENEDNLFDIRSKVGMVFQNPDNQMVSSIVEEDVAFGPENLGMEPKEIRRMVDFALDRVNMSQFALANPHQLSGGQKQRIAIAGVLAMNTECIVLDEPTAMLDPSGCKEVMDTIKMLNKEMNVTIILITHHMDEAAMADRVIVMNDGKILIDGTPHYVFQNAGLLKSVGLDVPQSTEIMFMLRENGIRSPLAVLTDEECVEVIENLLKERVKEKNE